MEPDIVFYIRLIAIIIEYGLGVIMLYKTTQIEDPISKKRYFTGITLCFLTHSTCRLFFLIDDYHFEELGIQTFTTIGAFLGVLSIVFVVLIIENVIYKKSHYIFTIIGTVGLFFDFLDILFLTENRFWVQSSINLIITVFIILIYITHTIKSTGTIRTHFLVFTIGIILLALGELGSMVQVYTLFPLSQIIAPILMLTGLFILFYSVIRYYK